MAWGGAWGSAGMWVFYKNKRSSKCICGFRRKSCEKAMENFQERARAKTACETGGDCGSVGLKGFGGVFTMVGMYYIGQDIRRTRTSAALPTHGPWWSAQGMLKRAGCTF